MQPTLFDDTEPEPPETDDRTPYQRFRDFHADNPGVYVALREMARALRSKGFERYGIAGIVEALRYTMALDSGRDKYRINNNFRAFYARMIMERCPDLAGFFETRKSEADVKAPE